MNYFFIYPLIGIMAGLLSGLLGIGGGIIVVPALAFVFTKIALAPTSTMHMAAGTSFAIMIITASSSMLAHHARGNVLWSVWLRLLPGMLTGVIIGAICANYLTTRILEIIFGLFLLFIAWKMLVLAVPKPTRKLPKWPGMSFVALLIGGKSGLLGVGGGAITIPFLTYCNVPMRKASGISIACTLPIAIVGTLSFITIGWHQIDIPLCLGYVYLPAFFGVGIASCICAPIGAALSGHANVSLLKRIFAVFLVIASIRLLI